MNKTKKLTMVSMLFALALVLSIVENLMPQIHGVIPGIKLGLSNIVVMYTLIFLGPKHAFSIALLKAMFTLMTRGLIAFTLSLCGGVSSILIMLILMKIIREISYVSVSICGSVTHNIMQLVLAVFITGSKLTIAYFPILLISGIAMGVVTGTILCAVMPYFKKFNY